MVESVDDVNQLQEKSAALKLESSEYKQNSVEVRRLTWWQTLKCGLFWEELFFF